MFVAGWCHVGPAEQVVHATPYCVYESRTRVAKNSLKVVAGRSHFAVQDGDAVQLFGLAAHVPHSSVVAATYFGYISRSEESKN